MANESILNAFERMWQHTVIALNEKANVADIPSIAGLATEAYADQAAAAIKNDLLNGAGDAYDTLKELGELIDENKDAIDALEIIATEKADKVHTHAKSQITDFPTSMPASDVSAWAKAASKPTYTASEVGARPSTWTPTAADVGAATCVTITIPKGRMRGDIDGDGKITATDSDLIMKKLGGNVTFDDIQTWCGDVSIDGLADSDDVVTISRFVKGYSTVLTSTISTGIGPTMADYYNNWTYVKVDDLTGYFYTDIAISGMTTTSSAIVAIQGSYEKDFFSAECIAGAIRIKANLCPIAEIKAVVQHGDGDGAAIVICEGVNILADFIAVYNSTSYDLLATAYFEGRQMAVKYTHTEYALIEDEIMAIGEYEEIYPMCSYNVETEDFIFMGTRKVNSGLFVVCLRCKANGRWYESSYQISEASHTHTAAQIGAATVEYVNNAIESLYGADAPAEGEETLSVREIANEEATSVVSTQELITVEDIDEICK